MTLYDYQALSSHEQEDYRYHCINVRTGQCVGWFTTYHEAHAMMLQQNRTCVPWDSNGIPPYMATEAEDLPEDD